MSITSTSPTYHDALTLDIHTLSLLLQRNHDQHRRCIYYRRMTMVYSAIRSNRFPSFDKVNGWIGQFKGLVRLLMDECEGLTLNSVRRRRKEEQWTLENNELATIEIMQHNDDKDTLQQQQQQQQINQLATIIKQLKMLITQTIPQIKSRIIHATSPILCEISRGYFVPFLTVALACFGRIHTLCLSMGREVVMVLQEMIPQLRVLCGDNRKKRGSGGDGYGMDSMEWKRLEEVVMPQFSVERIKNGREQGRNSMATTVSQEWNDLMTHFLDVSQDDLTKQINVFVKEKRWEDAMSSFGLQTRSDVSNCSNPSELSVKQLGSGHGMEECGGRSDDDDDDDDETETNVNTSKSNIPSSHNDMGELVDNMNPTRDHDENQTAVDDNMARIMKRGKEGKRPATTTPASESSSTVSKKKRRKRKKGKCSTVVANGTSGDDNERQLQLQSSGLISVDSEREDREPETLANATPLWEENETNAKESKQNMIAESTGVEEEAMTIVQPDSSIRNEEEKSSERKQKKSKKKSSKKAKKQKRKSSVIDDIFGF